MQAGKLRHRMTLQRPAQQQDPLTGEMVPGWEDVPPQVWAAVEPVSARDFIAAAATQSQVTARITIRHRADVKADMRLVHGTRIYTIHGVLPDPKSGREYLTLPVSEGVKDG